MMMVSNPQGQAEDRILAASSSILPSRKTVRRSRAAGAPPSIGRSTVAKIRAERKAIEVRSRSIKGVSRLKFSRLRATLLAVSIERTLMGPDLLKIKSLRGYA
jgi:hypothetical protein